jgi:hypothetical protein
VTGTERRRGRTWRGKIRRVYKRKGKKRRKCLQRNPSN